MINLYRPIKCSHINQPFGVNYCNFYKQLGLLGHNGIDWCATEGEEVYFNFKGKGEVISVSDSWTKGLGVTVLVEMEGIYYKLVFWHFKKYVVKIGDIVETGDLLGYADNSGMSTGTHLHFGMYYSNRFGNTIGKNNGYDGAIDPMPYYQDYFVKDVMDNLNKQVNILQKMINLVKNFLLNRK